MSVSVFTPCLHTLYNQVGMLVSSPHVCIPVRNQAGMLISLPHICMPVRDQVGMLMSLPHVCIPVRDQVGMLTSLPHVCIPVRDQVGKIYEFRLMMDFSGSNRGYCFVTYTNREDARTAITHMNNYQIRPGRFLGVCASVDNCRLFVGGIPKNKQQEEILEEMIKVLF